MRPLGTVTRTASAQTITKPVYLARIELAAPLYLSSREQMSYLSTTYSAAGLRVDVPSARIALFNKDNTYTASFLSASGTPVRVFMGYGSTITEADTVLEGEIGAVSVGEWITLTVRPAPMTKVPRVYVLPPAFNYLPPDGLRIQTLSGTYVLNRGTK